MTSTDIPYSLHGSHALENAMLTDAEREALTWWYAQDEVLAQARGLVEKKAYVTKGAKGFVVPLVLHHDVAVKDRFRRDHAVYGSVDQSGGPEVRLAHPRRPRELAVFRLPHGPCRALQA